MMSNRRNWDYRHNQNNSVLPLKQNRYELLINCPSFETLIQYVANELNQIEFEIEMGLSPELKRFHAWRASWFFDVEAETFDCLFNGPNGLRAQYYYGVDFGIAMNQKLIHPLKDQLLAFAQKKSEMPLDKIAMSLNHIWARLWIVESQAHWDDEIEIINDWIQHPTLGDIGREAPCGRRLYINGAWITKSGAPCIYSAKTNRSYDIYRYGFS